MNTFSQAVLQKAPQKLPTTPPAQTGTSSEEKQNIALYLQTNGKVTDKPG